MDFAWIANAPIPDISEQTRRPGLMCMETHWREWKLILLSLGHNLQIVASYPTLLRWHITDCFRHSLAGTSNPAGYNALYNLILWVQDEECKQSMSKSAKKYGGTGVVCFKSQNPDDTGPILQQMTQYYKISRPTVKLIATQWRRE